MNILFQRWSIDRLSEGIEAWRFLLTISSAIFVCTTLANVLIFAGHQSQAFDPQWTFIITFPGMIISLLLIVILHLFHHGILRLGSAIFLLYLLILILAPLVRKVIPWLWLTKDNISLEWIFGLSMILMIITSVSIEVIRSIISVHKIPSPYKTWLLPRRQFTSVIYTMFAIPPIVGRFNSWIKRLISILLFICAQLLIFMWTYALLSKLPTWVFYYTNYRINTNCSWTYLDKDCLNALFSWLEPILGFIAIFIIAMGFRRIAQKYSRTSVENLRKKDNRAPILFLRSFSDDRILLRSPKRSLWRRMLFSGNSRPFLDHILMEECTHIGPVTAIGAPDKRQPFGVARTYKSDSEWQNTMRGLANESTMIAISVDYTMGVQWELDELISSGWDYKTIFFLPPRLLNSKESMIVLKHILSRLLKVDEDAAEVSARKIYKSPESVIALFWATNPKCNQIRIDSNNAEIVVCTAKDTSYLAYTLAVRRFISSRKVSTY